MKKLIFCLTLCLFTVCQKEKAQKEVESASPYTAETLSEFIRLDKVIVHTPSALLSVSADIEITFNRDMISDNRVGLVLPENPISFKPEIKGRTLWVSRNMLRFEPENLLPSGTAFKAVLSGKQLMGAQQEIDDYAFNFKILEQEVLSFEGDFEVSEKGKNQVQFVGTITFAMDIVPEKIKKDLSLRGPSGNIAFTIGSGDSPKICRIKSEPVTRQASGQSFSFRLPKAYTADQKKWEKTWYLPAIDKFKVLGHMDMSDPEAGTPVYGFRFSDPVQKDADLSGFITLDPPIEHTVRVNNKYLLIAGDFIPGRTYTIQIAKGLPCAFRTVLEEDYQQDFTLDNIKPEIQWLSPGIYLPADNDFRLQFKSVNVARIEVSVHEIFPQNTGFFLQSNLLNSRHETERYYDDSDFQDLSRVGERIYYKKHPVTDQRNKWIKTEIDLDSILTGKPNSLFVIGLRFTRNDLTGKCTNDRLGFGETDLYFEDDDFYSNPCEDGYYYRRGFIERCLIASEIGLTLKRSEDGLHVYANHTATSRPVSGLVLQLFTYNNRPAESRTTDGDGHALFKEEGSYLLGRSGQGIALMQLDAHPWEINNFDVAGSEGAVNGIDVFMYLDRGVHRPGDTLYFSAIIRMDRKTPPEKQPVLLKIRNPQAQITLNQKAACGKNGHVCFTIPTEMNDPTGNWRAELEVGGQKFYKTLKIETVKPNRLKIQMDLPEAVYAGQETVNAAVTVKYLFGAPAAGLKTRIRMSIEPTPFSSARFKDFSFQSAWIQYRPQTKTVFDGMLDDQGMAVMETGIPELKQVPSLLKAGFITTVSEKGGSFVETRTSTTIYPYETYVGLRSPFPGRYAKTGEQYKMPVIVLDPQGNPVSGHPLKVNVYLNNRYWWYHYDERDRQDFKEMASTYTLSETMLYSEDKPVEFRFNIEDEGTHFIEVTDMVSGHRNTLSFYGSSWGSMPQDENTPRNTLRITANQKTFQPGDQAELRLETPGEGIILFTLEQGQDILHQEWVPVKNKQTVVSFKITERMIPNCYAVLSFIQPHNQNTNDLPMRLYGIQTLYVEDAGTRLPLSLKMPDELRPKQRFDVQVTNAGKNESSCTIAIVDEGLLDLTLFSTPHPWDYFFQKIRLGVRTCDNFDEIIGVLYPDIDKYISIGGGLAEAAREKRLGTEKTRRFKPVVLFREPFIIGPGKTVKTTFTMPNYIGSVRAMVVGCAGRSYAAAEKTVPVRQPVMILPTVPRVARPGDVFQLPVSVFAMDSLVREVALQVTLSDNLLISGPGTQQLRFDRPGEKEVHFSVKAGDALGAGTIEIKASAGDFKSDYSVNLPVNSANPFMTIVTDTAALQNKPIVLTPVKMGIEGSNTAWLTITRTPDIQLQKRFSYLIRYPYGCLEQIVSSIFPQLYLPGLVDLSDRQQKEVTRNINEGIERLKRFRMDEGFSYWPHTGYQHSRYSSWGTNYLGHFLISAREAGYHVPDALFDHWLKDAKKRARDIDSNDYRYQAYRLYLLALAGEPHAGAMNLLRENHITRLDPLSRKFLAAAYYLSGQKNVATEIDRKTIIPDKDYRELGSTFGSTVRDLALMTLLSLQTGDQQTAARLVRDLVKQYQQKRWYSTHETAMTLLALGEFQADSGDPGNIRVKVSLPGQPEKTMTLTRYQTRFDLDNAWGKRLTVTNLHASPVYVSLYREGIPVEDKTITENYGIALNRIFYDEDGLAITIDSRESGKAFWVVYTIQSQYGQQLENLALSSIFPTGWEIINTRLTGEQPPAWLKRLGLQEGDYMDIRDDRINWFFDLPSRGKINLGAKINPSFRGSYVLPPLSVEAMYSPEYFARIKGGRVTVE